MFQVYSKVIQLYMYLYVYAHIDIYVFFFRFFSITGFSFFLATLWGMWNNAGSTWGIPLPGIEPTPPAVEVQSHNHWATRGVSIIGYYNILNIVPYAIQ